MACGAWPVGPTPTTMNHFARLQAAVDRGCNFFDTAYAYGNGRSENLLGQIVRSNPGKRLYTATKIPPKNLQWPALD
jgi:aryl-alcohol dehydrogenase-like predicted oxidoreductase